MTRLNDKIARLNAFKDIVEYIKSNIESTKEYAEQLMQNHNEEPQHPYYEQWAQEKYTEVKAMESALLEIIDLAVSK